MLACNCDISLNGTVGTASTPSFGARFVNSILSTSGTMNVTVVGNLGLLASDSSTQLYSGGPQTVTATGAITLQAGSGNFTQAQIISNANQNISAASLVLAAGSGGSVNAAIVEREGNQTVTVSNAISLVGGASGVSNYANLQSQGNQSISVGAGGLSLIGGGGVSPSDSNNWARIASTGGGTQTITVNNGGAVNLLGGSSSQAGDA